MSTAGELSGAKARPKPDLFTPNRKDSDVRKAYPKDPLGWFCEEPWTIEALWRFEKDHGGIPDNVWDPACGAGNIPRTLQSLGLFAFGSDIVDRGYEYGIGGHDFLAPLGKPLEAGAIVTNPPYGLLAERFILRALEIAPYVAMLVQAKFPYSQGRYERLWRQHPPARILFLVDRPSMPPGHLVGKITAKGGKMDFMFAVWDKRSTGQTTAHWIRRPGK